MKCCGSPTTFTARNALPAERERPRELAAQFGALLFAEAFKPLAKALGFYGDTVVASATQAMARSERGGLTDALEHALEAAARSATRSSEPVR